jgi:hypothetical protein
MSAYQLGYLFGTLLGAVLGFALVYKLVKSQKKSNRILAAVLGILGLGAVLSSVGRNNVERQHDEFSVGYKSGCMESCGAAGTDKAQCTSFCDCQVSNILSSPDADAFIKRLGGVRSEADIAPELRTRLVEVGAACMPPEVYDANFIKACVGGCSDAQCQKDCRCILDNLRAGKDPRAGTAWLMKNVDGNQLTPEGEARTSQAKTACALAAIK